MPKTHRRPTTQDAIDNLTFAPGKSPAIGDLMKSDGFFDVGDPGAGTWEHLGVTGTASQSPVQLDGIVFNDPSGNQWSLIVFEDLSRALGAIGDGVNIDGDIIQIAYDFVKNNKKSFELLGGLFRCTSTLNFDGIGVNTKGVGSQSTLQTVLLIDHNDGPGVHISAGRQKLDFVRVKGSDSRQIAPPDIADCGILIEPPDTPDNLISQIGMDWVLCDDHNGSGIVVNQVTGLTMEQTVVRDCRRHGFVFGNSDESTRINKDFWTGQLFASECRFSADGYSVLIGAEGGVAQAEAVFRVHMRSVDSDQGPRNSAGLMIDPGGWWVRGNNIIIENSAFNPGDTSAEALVISGRNISVGPTNRLLGLDTSDYAIRVLNWVTTGTNDLLIDRPLVIDPANKPALAVVVLDTTSSATRAPVADNTVNVESNQPRNGTILEVLDKRKAGWYSDQLETRDNTNFLTKTFAIPQDNQFVTIAGGVLDVDRSSVLVLGEGDVADSIDTINFKGGTPPDGMILEIMAGSSGQNITINNNTGNVRCGSNRLLDSNSDLIVLKYRDGINAWAQKSFSDNS